MILIETQEYPHLGAYRKETVFLQYNDDNFVNRSSTVKEALKKIKLKRTQYCTHQSIDQMERVFESKEICTSENIRDKYPEYLI